MYDPIPTNNTLPAMPEQSVDCPPRVPDPLVLAVLTASYISGGDDAKQQKAILQEGSRLLALSDIASPETVQTLAAQLPVLEALFLNLAKDAAEATRPAEKVKLLKASLQAQESYGRTVALIAKLNKRKGGWETIDEVSWR